jgi:hypothetical protein
LRPDWDTVASCAYASHQKLFDAAVPHGLHYYWRSDYIASLSDPVIDVLIDHAWASRTRRSYTILFQLGGTLLDAAAESVFSGRQGFAVNIGGVWQASETADHQWVLAEWTALHNYSSGTYVNFLAEGEDDRVEVAYGGPAGFSRLRELKNRYDPDNVFRGNANVAPATSARR